MWVLSGRNLAALGNLAASGGTVILSAGVTESEVEPCLIEIERKEVPRFPDSII